MALPDSYTIKTGSIQAYFDAVLDAQPPERFSTKFLENLGFTSTNDRLFIGILKDLGFLNRDGTPQQRYFDFMDRDRSKAILAEGIREAYADLFAINTKANEFTIADAKNKLRTLYAGKKTDLVIGNVAKTFRALCDYADFTARITGETRKGSLYRRCRAARRARRRNAPAFRRASAESGPNPSLWPAIPHQYSAAGNKGPSCL